MSYISATKLNKGLLNAIYFMGQLSDSECANSISVVNRTDFSKGLFSRHDQY
jgi:hypothetical protein